MKIEVNKIEKKLKNTSIKTDKKNILVMATGMPFRHKKERLDNNINLTDIYINSITTFIFKYMQEHGIDNYETEFKNIMMKTSITLYKFLKENNITYVKHDQPLCDLFIIYIDKHNIHTISMGDFAVLSNLTDKKNIFKFTQNTSVASIRKANSKLLELDKHKKEPVSDYDKVKILYSLYKNQQNQRNFMTVYPDQSILKHKQYSKNNVNNLNIMSGIVLMNKPFLTNTEYQNIINEKDIYDVKSALTYKNNSLFQIKEPEIVKIVIK